MRDNYSDSLNIRLKKLKERLFVGMGVPEKTDFKPDDFQLEAIGHLANRDDVLVSAPTGSGKTFIAIEAIKSIVSNGQRAVYTTPLKALSNSKYADFKHRFPSVGLLTGDRKVDADAQVIVATTEIYRNELYRGAGSFALVVLDEVHYIADQQRGPVWEECIILSPKDASLLMLSASISNYDQISDWVTSVRDKQCRVVTRRLRPIPLRMAFLHPQFGVIPIDDGSGNIVREVLQYYDVRRGDRGGDRRHGGRGHSSHRGSRSRGRGRGR